MFNPVTLADRCDDDGWVGTFTPIDVTENWFAEDMKKKELTDYFKLDLRSKYNRQLFANHDGFGDDWLKKLTMNMTTTLLPG